MRAQPIRTFGIQQSHSYEETIAMSVYIRERSQVNSLMILLNVQEEQEQTKSQIGRWKEIKNKN
jgi:hypothetical protein